MYDKQTQALEGAREENKALRDTNGLANQVKRTAEYEVVNPVPMPEPEIIESNQSTQVDKVEVIEISDKPSPIAELQLPIHMSLKCEHRSHFHKEYMLEQKPQILAAFKTDDTLLDVC